MLRVAQGHFFEPTFTTAVSHDAIWDLGRAAAPRWLPAPLQAKFEALVDKSLSKIRVRVNDGPRRWGANALTIGNEIHVLPERYRPHSPGGQLLLAHEVAHALQQAEARVTHPTSSEVRLVQRRDLDEEARFLASRFARRHGSDAKQRWLQPQTTRTTLRDPDQVHWSVSQQGAETDVSCHYDGERIGGVKLHDESKARLFVSDLLVEPSYRGFGLGRQLLKTAAREAQRRERADLELEADDDGSGKLLRWYKGLGFREVGRSKRNRALLRVNVTELTTAFAPPRR